MAPRLLSGSRQDRGAHGGAAGVDARAWKAPARQRAKAVSAAKVLRAHCRWAHCRWAQAGHWGRRRPRLEAAECGAEAARQPVAEGDGRGPWRDGGVGEALHVASSIPAGHLREA